MRNFMAGVVFGIVIASVGFTGLARMMDKTVDVVKTQSKELAQ
jgi:hypothetical protein